MANGPENLVLEHLRAIRGDVLAVRHDIGELKTTVAGILQILAAHDNRLLRMDQRLERIETASAWSIQLCPETITSPPVA